MISIAVNIVFFWVLSLTMQTTTVKELPDSKPAIIQEQKPKEPISTAPIPPGPAPVLTVKPGM